MASEPARVDRQRRPAAPQGSPAAVHDSGLHDGGGRGGVSRRAMEAAVAAGFIAIGLGMMAANAAIGVHWSKDGPEAGYFPFRIGGILALCGAGALLGLRRRAPGDRAAFVAPERFRSVLAVLLPTGLYVLATQLLGIYVASALFIGSFMRVLGSYGWLRCAAVGVGFSALVFWTFETEFLIPLPKGPLEAWLGY